MSEDNEELDSSNQSSEEDVKTDAVEDESAHDESEDLEAIKEKNKKLFERAKKAETEAKEWKAKASKPEPKVEAPVEKQTEYDLEDVAVLVAKVSDKEDRDFVKRSAKLLDLTLEETLNDPVVAGKLKEAAEKRTSAGATNTGASRRGVSKPNTDTVLSNVEKGKLPDDPEDWVNARMEDKKNNK